MFKAIRTDIGKLVVFSFSLYAIYVNYLLIIQQDKGILPSPFSLFILLLLGCLCLSNMSIHFLNRLFDRSFNKLIFCFILYYFVSIFFQVEQTYSFHISAFLTSLLPGFMLGILAFGNFKFHPFLRRNPQWESEGKISRTKLIFFRWVTIVFLVYFSVQILLNNFGSLVLQTLQTVDNYQEVGDYCIVLYTCLIAAKIQYWQNYQARKITPYLSMTLITLLEIVFLTIFLQTLGSNKGPLTIGLIGASYLFFLIPTGVILRPKFIFGILSGLIAVSIVLYIFVDQEMLAAFRLFSDGQSGDSTGLGIRIEQLFNDGTSQLKRNVLFGDLSIMNYIHSSVVTVQTHLGIIGSLLFWGFMLVQLIIIYFYSGNVFLKTVTLPILFVSIISSAFYWLPLWFLMGILYMYPRYN